MGEAVVSRNSNDAIELVSDGYVFIAKVMSKIAGFFGKEVLAQINEDEFYSSIKIKRGIWREYLQSSSYQSGWWYESLLAVI